MKIPLLIIVLSFAINTNAQVKELYIWSFPKNETSDLVIEGANLTHKNSRDFIKNNKKFPQGYNVQEKAKYFLDQNRYYVIEIPKKLKGQNGEEAILLATSPYINQTMEIRLISGGINPKNIYILTPNFTGEKSYSIYLKKGGKINELFKYTFMIQ